MSSKPTTSDQLKIVFKYALQSDEKDWKRTAKFKNEAGQWVRSFENRQTGDSLDVTDLGDGKFNIKGAGMEANVSIPVAFAAAVKKNPGAPAAPALTATIIETDPAKNAAADQAIAIILGEAPESEEADAEWGVPHHLLETAGRALANRHCFAISAEDGTVAAMITPVKYFEQNGHCSDQSGPVGHLLPKGAELMESTWEIYDKKIKTPVEVARYLQEQGFVWNRAFQDFIDRSQTAKLAKHIAPAPADAAARPASQKPQRPKPGA